VRTGNVTSRQSSAACAWVVIVIAFIAIVGRHGANKEKGTQCECSSTAPKVPSVHGFVSCLVVLHTPELAHASALVGQFNGPIQWAIELAHFSGPFQWPISVAHFSGPFGSLSVIRARRHDCCRLYSLGSGFSQPNVS
jgi:hypothetical protein